MTGEEIRDLRQTALQAAGGAGGGGALGAVAGMAFCLFLGTLGVPVMRWAGRIIAGATTLSAAAGAMRATQGQALPEHEVAEDFLRMMGGRTGEGRMSLEQRAA